MMLLVKTKQKLVKKVRIMQDDTLDLCIAIFEEGEGSYAEQIMIELRKEKAYRAGLNAK